MTPVPESFDVIVIGGGHAGLSAALQLARARRTVLVIDAGEPRNRSAARSHGFLTRDGARPLQLLHRARAQLLRYPTVQWRADRAVDARRERADRFVVACESGHAVAAQRLVLAYGVRDALPDIDGLAGRWGRGVFHCPYCHGYELAQGRIGLLSDDAGTQALLLSEWGTVTWFLRADGAIDDALAPRLAARGVVLERTPVVRVEGDVGIVLADGRVLAMDALFVSPEAGSASPLAGRLGCSHENGGCITTDASKQTTVRGVFACGDVARMAGSIPLAVGEGALAGVAAHRSLLGLLD